MDLESNTFKADFTRISETLERVVMSEKKCIRVLTSGGISFSLFYKKFTIILQIIIKYLTNGL